MQQPSLTPAIHAGSLARTSAFQTVGVYAPPTVQWSFTPPDTFFSTPTLVEQGVVYVGCDDGRVYALDTRTGGIRWAFATHDPDPDPEDVLYGEEVHPEVTELCLDVDGGYAYVGSIAGVLYEVDLATGRELRHWILPDLLPDETFEDDAYITALTLDGGRLLFAVGESFERVFTLLDRRTDALTILEDFRLGIMLMTLRTAGAQMAFTVSFVGNHGEVNLWALGLPDATHADILAHCMSVARGFDDRWEEGDVAVGDTDGYLPLVDDSLFAVGVILHAQKTQNAQEAGDGKATEGEEDEEDEEDEDGEPIERLLALDPDTGKVRWSCADLTDLQGYGGNRTLAAAGSLVFVHLPSAGVVDAVDIHTHEVRWRYRSAPAFPGSVGQLIRVGDTHSRIDGTELFVADGLLYLIEHVGKTTKRSDGLEQEYMTRVFAVDALSGDLRWSWSYPTGGTGGHELRSTIADGAIYLVAGRTLYALR
jgi:outer membrane protein assembly factor BamB